MSQAPTSDVLRVRLGAWYGDEERVLEVPRSWDVDVLEPRTPPPLTDADISAAVKNPVGCPPLRLAAAGKRRPLIIVDDLTRPTPTDLVVPHVLRELAAAGIAPENVAIILASGAHGLPARDAVMKKAGAEAAAACRLLTHDAREGGVKVGRTSFGTPVIVDREVAASDLLIGAGGVYPQHSVGFGGGSKLVLGVLARRSIIGLHYGHSSVAGSYDVDNDFRRDLDEMARIVGLRMVIALHVDGERRPVRAVAGDPNVFYEEAARFSLRRYAVRDPGDDYDVVVANAYPMDVSLTFARSKGLTPLAHAGSHATRVLIAACPEGLGLHRLFPFANGPRFEAQIHQLRRWSVLKPSSIPRRALGKASSKLRRFVSDNGARDGARPHQQFAGDAGIVLRRPVLLWSPLAPTGSLPENLPTFARVRDWKDVVSRVEADHPGRERLRVAVYACSPLQCLRKESAVDSVSALHVRVGPGA